MKEKLKDLFMVMLYLGSIGAMFGLSIYRALPANGWSDYQRGEYATVAPLFGLFFVFGLLAFAGMLVQWWEKA